MTYWITKYALTKGIQEVEGEERNFGRLVVDKMLYFRKNEWHRSRAEAVIQAESMRSKKLVSLAKQSDKIQSLTFQ